MNKEEIDDWLRYFSNNNQCFMSKDGKIITLFKVFQELKELQYLLKIKNDYINELDQKNQELKKQLEEINKFKFSYKNDQTKIPPIIRKQKDVETIKNLENQQKEFVEWLENEANINSYDISDYIYENIINVILSKYYEIIEK